MKVLQFVKTTVIGGLVYLLPFVFILFMVAYIGKQLLPLFRNVAERLDAPLISSAALVIVVLAALLLVLCFLAGLFARSRLVFGLRDWIAEHVLGRTPIYRILESVGEELEGGHPGSIQVALAWTNGWQLAFVVERHADGNATLVFPDAPAATSGTIVYLPMSRVHLLDLKVADVLHIQHHMGLGSAALLQGKLPPAPA